MTAYTKHSDRRGMAVSVLFALVVLAIAYQFPLSAPWTHPRTVLGGFYELEGVRSSQPYRWTGHDAALWFPALGTQALQLRLTWNSPRPAGTALPSVTVSANGRPLQTLTVTRQVQTTALDIPADVLWPAGDLSVTIQSETFSVASDLRALGVAVYDARIEPAANRPLPVIPAPMPVTWGLIVVALVYAAARGQMSERRAWLISVGIALIIGVGLAAARLWTDGALPWAVLAAVVAFVFTRRD